MTQIVIRPDELQNPMIDHVIEEERSLRGSEGEFIDNISTPFYLNPVFYYSIACVLGAFLAWLGIEPYIDDQEPGIALIDNYVVFASVAAAIGTAVGLTYGIANRNIMQALYCAIVGLGVALGVTVLTSLIGGWVYGFITMVAVTIGSDFITPEEGFAPQGLSFFVLMCGRALAWAIISMGAGLGLGVALKSKKLSFNGLAGGMIGGMLGGLMFDPVHRFIMDWGPNADTSRCVGFMAVGLLVGVFVGFLENVSKEAWFVMVKGPLKGKQFILFKSPMYIGSAPKCDIYVFKDPAVEPKHAQLVRSGNRQVIEDTATESGTWVNGKKVDRCILQAGDVVSIGETVLKYNERERR